jgi:hypothetical protein
MSHVFYSRLLGKHPDAFLAKVPNRAVDVDSRALPACSFLVYGMDYIFTPMFIGGRRIGYSYLNSPDSSEQNCSSSLSSLYGVRKEIYIPLLEFGKA